MGPRARRAAVFTAKAAVALGAIAYIVGRQPWPELVAAVSALAPGSLVLSFGVLMCGFGLGALRWRLVMHALGATQLPSLVVLLRMYLVGLFYNTYLPFAVGGDVMRGVVTQRAFAGGNVTASVASVLVERLLGLSAVLVWALVALLLGAGGAAQATLATAAALALPCALAGALGLPWLRLLSPALPDALGRRLAALPRFHSYPAFVAALFVSFGTQLVVVLATHVLALSAYPATALRDSLFAAPLAASAAFLPVSVAGVGPRDVVLVALYGLCGMPRPQGTATALAMLVVTLSIALLGGLLSLGGAPPGAARDQTGA
jgi:glycosyltransferase 2 family protein